MSKKLRVGFFYPSRCMWNPVDPNSIWASDRGLTGSELAFFMYAIGIAKLGHGVTIFTKFTRGGDIGNITCCQYEEWDSIYRYQGWDALCSWMVPDPLESAPQGSFRLFNQQVSDFNMCQPGWESHVDILAPLSSSHAKYMKPMTSFPDSKWRVMHNGVDVDDFKPGIKIPGKMIWASSHDRGLHWLLEMFPLIKKRVPHANLHIFYDFGGVERFAAFSESEPISHHRELGYRSRYIKEAIRRLEGLDVFVHQSVSRERMQDEMATAEILAYPCDPVHYTETFGVTVLEACAAGAIPVLCTADAFGELWGNITPNVPPPFANSKRVFLDLVCKVLSSDEIRESYVNKCSEYAKLFQWNILSNALELNLYSRGDNGLAHVDWLL